MLKEAQQKLREGINVVIGVIDTHGRKETDALLQGLPIIPEKQVEYKEVVFKELDLESILNTKPALILIDELAHTNIPGSKHSKRWEDIVEILDSGIDVYTTLNIQHVESQKDSVESLTGIQVRETVPDLILERADTLEFIDISPSDLLERLKEGKVYLGDQSSTATQNFFQENNIKTLREIALRFRDEKVDSDVHGLLGKGWKPPERVMVAISPNRDSEQLLHKAKRLALALEASWIAIYVDRGVPLNAQDQASLSKHLHLARELGAEVITTRDQDVSSALQRMARQKDITRLLIPRQPRKKFSIRRLLQGRLFEPIESEDSYADIMVLKQDKFTDFNTRSMRPLFLSSWEAYRLTLAFGVGMTALGFLVIPLLGYQSVGFIFLLGIQILSFFVGIGPIFLAALLSALCWDFLFIPPIFSLKNSDPQDMILVMIYFVTAGVMGILTSRMHEQERFLQKREEKIEHLYEIQKEIFNATTFQDLRLNVSTKLGNIFQGKFDLLIKNQDNQLIFDSQHPLLAAEKEQTTATWVCQHGEIAGWSTDTLPSVKGLYFPIKVSYSSVGVLAYFPEREVPLSIEEMNFIQTVTQQLGIYLERCILEFG